jgi:hypothetical protein
MPFLVVVSVSWKLVLVTVDEESRAEIFGEIIVAPSGGLNVKVALST